MPDLAGVDARARALFDRVRGLVSVAEDARTLKLEVPGLEGEPWGYLGGTRLGARYVSVYLMALYARPELVAGISPALRARMQGKSCFNLARIDEPLLAELGDLVERCVVGQLEAVRAGEAPARAERAGR